jgi:hypothetical protein
MTKVYFLQCGGDGPIKIGITARDIEYRLNDIQSNTPFEIKCLATISGSLKHERWLHHKFRNFRLRGEWFNAADQILELVENINSARFKWPSRIPRHGAMKHSRPSSNPLIAELENSGKSASQLAAEIGISRACLYLWEKVPGEMVVKVEKVAGIPREKLRPDLYRH